MIRQSKLVKITAEYVLRLILLCQEIISDYTLQEILAYFESKFQDIVKTRKWEEHQSPRWKIKYCLQEGHGSELLLKKLKSDEIFTDYKVYKDVLFVQVSYRNDTIDSYFDKK